MAAFVGADLLGHDVAVLGQLEIGTVQERCSEQTYGQLHRGLHIRLLRRYARLDEDTGRTRWCPIARLCRSAGARYEQRQRLTTLAVPRERRDRHPSAGFRRQSQDDLGSLRGSSVEELDAGAAARAENVEVVLQRRDVRSTAGPSVALQSQLHCVTDGDLRGIE